MNKIIFKILFLIGISALLNSCATPVGHSYNTSQRYVAVTNMWPEGFTDNFMTGFTLGLISPKNYDFYAYANSREEAVSKSEKKCRDFASSKGWTQKVTCKLYHVSLNNGTYNAGYNDTGSRTYNNNKDMAYTYSNSKPVMFYDSSTGQMRECAGSILMGTCDRYAAFNASSYDYDTLFYNPSTGAMQRCLNHSFGKCLQFRPQPVIANQDQLFYNPRTRSMSPCLNSNNQGQCLAFGIAQTKKADTGSYIVDDPSNPYYKKVPDSAESLIRLGQDMMSGRCTLGLNC